MATLADQIPEDWYSEAFGAGSAAMAWTDRTGTELDGVAKILQTRGGERGLDVAVQTHLRELDYEGAFDRVPNLNDGAIGYLESGEQDRRSFEVIARALRPRGRNFVELPNVLYAHERLPQRSWIPASSMVELIESRWKKRAKSLAGLTAVARFGEVLEKLDRIEFSQRPYSVDELRKIYASVGLELLRTCNGSDRPKGPKASQFEIFVDARKAS